MEFISDTLPNHPFRKFSLQLYAKEVVKQVLLDLQNDYRLEVNMLLFCGWYAKAGYGRFNQRKAKRLHEITALWHHGIVHNLQKIEEQLNKLEKKQLTKAVLAEVLAADHIEQLMLADTLSELPNSKRSPLQRLRDAQSNLEAYCRIRSTSLDPSAHMHLTTLLSATFPTIPLENISTYYVKKEEKGPHPPPTTLKHRQSTLI